MRLCFWEIKEASHQHIFCNQPSCAKKDKKINKTNSHQFTIINEWLKFWDHEPKKTQLPTSAHPRTPYKELHKDRNQTCQWNKHIQNKQNKHPLHKLALCKKNSLKHKWIKGINLQNKHSSKTYNVSCRG